MKAQLSGLLALSCATVSAQGITESAKLISTDAGGIAEYGNAVAVSGDTLVVGAYRATFPTQAGAAYVYVRAGAGWSLEAKLTALDGAGGDDFGYAVDVLGDTIVVGARGAGNGTFLKTGAAYVFTRSGATWSQQQKLVDAGGAIFDEFGSSVSLGTNRAVVGVPDDDEFGGSDAGSAFVFVRSGSTWSQEAKLLSNAPLGGGVGDQFGKSVAMSADGATVLVGAPFDDDTGTDAGATYAFARSGTAWSLQQKLVAAGGASSDFFGLSCSVAGNTAAVGAFGDDPAGAAYIFQRSGAVWTESQRLTASDAGVLDAFGRGLDLTTGRLVVGADAADGAVANVGAAYVFDLSGALFEESTKLKASDAELEDDFGWSVGVSGDTVVAGAPEEDEAGTDAGAAYVFALDAAAVTPFGSGINPAGSLLVLAGAPVIGTTLTLGLDNPLGTQGAGTLPFVGVAASPDPAFPAGTPLQGWGMAGPLAVGELLISLQLIDVLSGPAWSGPPTPVAVVVPDVPALIGVTAYAQGLLFDPIALQGVDFAFTEAFALDVGL